jgi:WD40 repeat protein
VVIGAGGDTVGNDGRDLIFLSYSHDDAEWAQRFTTMLRPLVRNKRLNVWVDEANIRSGEKWDPAIGRAIEQAQVAMLLVSGRFLSSRYITEVELPRLVAHGVPLAPVLVGDCMWKHVPELAERQWLHDVVREGALSLVADRIGELDRRVVRICDRLVEQLHLGPADPVAIPPPARIARSVATPRSGGSFGPLHGVPEDPPGYLVRDELPDLVAEVLDGTSAGVGLHGQGGLGKTVLAAAIARDKRVRGYCVDGVYWVTLGERADLLAAQRALLTLIGARGPQPRTSTDAHQQLAGLLADRRVLLVVDDVWSDAAAAAFRVTGPNGRLLYTTRDAQILNSARVRPLVVGTLSSDSAADLAATIIDVAPASLDTVARDAFEQVGRVALAVALVAAAVRGGGSWSNMSASLRQSADVYGDHPYANVFKAMQIAVAGLSGRLRKALLRLAVFPPDSRIPVAAITRYWHRTPEETAADLRDLAAAKVLQIQNDEVELHDLQRDYLLLHGGNPALLHADLLAAYRPSGHGETAVRWWHLSLGEPYIWDNLVLHLRGAGERRELADTVTDPAYLARRIVAGGGPHAAETDLDRAVDTLPDRPEIVWWRAWIGRHAHHLGEPEDIGGDAESGVAPTMLAWLVADDARPAHVDPTRLVPLMPPEHLVVRWGLVPPVGALLRVLTSHTGRVAVVEWSPKGTHLATLGRDDRQARLCRVDTAEKATTLDGHASGVNAVAWAPDGGALATAAYDTGEVHLWTPDVDQPVGTLSGHRGGVSAMAWSPDSRRLATAGYDDREVRVWSVATGRAIATTFVGRPSEVSSIAWSPDGSRLATVAIDDEHTRLWSPQLKGQGSIATDHASGGTVSWSPDGSCVASISPRGRLHLWRTANTEYTTLTGKFDRNSTIGWSPTGAWLAIGTAHGLVIWHPALGRPVAHEHGSRVRAFSWSPDRRRIAVGDVGGVRLWEPFPSHTVDFSDHPGGVSAMAWAPDGHHLATGDGDGKVRLWNHDAHPPGAAPASADGLGIVVAVAWSPDETGLATGHADGRVALWEPQTGAVRHQFIGHAGGVTALAWSSDDTRLVTTGYDGRLRIWDADTGRSRNVLRTGHIGEVTAMAWSPDGRTLATAGTDGKVQLWEASSLSRVVDVRVSGVSGLTWCADSSRLAVLSRDRTVRLLDPRSGRANTLRGKGTGITAMAWSPDGTELATAEDDAATIRLRRPDTGRLARSLGPDGAGRVFALAWSPDGAVLAAVDESGLLQLWTPRDGRRARTLTATAGPVEFMTWTHDGRQLVVVGRDGTLRVFDPACGRSSRLHLEPPTCVSHQKGGVAVGSGAGLAVVDLQRRGSACAPSAP